MAYLFRVMLLLLCVVFDASAGAPTILYGYRTPDYVIPPAVIEPRFSTANEACEAGLPLCGGNCGGIEGWTGFADGPICNKHKPGIGVSGPIGTWFQKAVCGNGEKLEGGQCIPDPSGQCSAGSERVDGVCQCKPGFKQGDMGSCVAMTDNERCGNDFRYAGWHVGGPYTSIWHLDGEYQHGAKFCMPFEPLGGGKGCMVELDMNGTSKNDDGSTSTFGTIKPVESAPGGGPIQGQSCMPTDSNNPGDGEGKKPEKAKCENGYQGEVNGVAACVPNVKDNGVNLGGDKKTETKPDGTKVDTEVKTECAGGKCTTTTTVTTTTPGGGTSTETTKVDQTERAYCQANPSRCTNGKADPGKGGSGTGTGGGGKGGGEDDEDKGKFGGSCTAGFTCEGDAIQCAIAKEQHKRACDMFEDRDNDAYRLYDKEKGKEGSVLGSLKGNKDVDISQYVAERDDFIGGGGCPADRVIQFTHGEVTIPYSKLCPYFEMLGTILIVCAGISGARIITRRDR